MNAIILKWNQTCTKGIRLSSSTKIETVLFAGDQMIIAGSEDNLRRGVFTLAKNFGVEISPE